ncbi:YisL family protein [Lentilactobacillus otakiensis]|uniref:YisL family protein n=1 Tax=Lentilactobacillus otakiensis TaxID=481720 RepID=UPI00041EC93B|nr:YisL family protein [Lentilactobacillus otakiensis]MBZ3777305.1 YisL family protein [Lentilactobacillus otakiensis]MDV3518564.1 YisL family protein [Lentilactobacillus otakiensis]
MIYINIHLISWILLIISTVLAFILKNKSSIVFQMITRVLYIPILISGFMLALYRVPREPVLGSLKVILGLAVIALLEIGFARKNHKNLAANILWTLGIVFVLTSLLGLVLAGWYFF